MPFFSLYFSILLLSLLGLCTLCSLGTVSQKQEKGTLEDRESSGVVCMDCGLRLGEVIEMKDGKLNWVIQLSPLRAVNYSGQYIILHFIQFYSK